MADKNYAEIGYVLGIISIVLAFFTPLAGLIFGIVGLVHSKKSKDVLSVKAKKLNIIGIVLSIIIGIIIIAVAIYTGLSSLNTLSVPGA